MNRITADSLYLVTPGDHFTLVLPDGAVLNVEQTQDDFSIVHLDGSVAYTRATSAHAKAEDANLPQTTGRSR